MPKPSPRSLLRSTLAVVMPRRRTRAPRSGSACRSRREVSGASRTQTVVTSQHRTTYTDTTSEVSKRSSSATEMIGASAPPRMPASW